MAPLRPQKKACQVAPNRRLCFALLWLDDAPTCPPDPFLGFPASQEAGHGIGQ